MPSVSLPWPARVLSPNGKNKGHWGVKHRATVKAKNEAFYLAKEAGLRITSNADRIKINCVFIQPDRRNRDEDNMISSLKAALDGVALALGVDDSRFSITWEFPDEIVKNGQVIVEVKE